MRYLIRKTQLGSRHTPGWPRHSMSLGVMSESPVCFNPSSLCLLPLRWIIWYMWIVAMRSNGNQWGQSQRPLIPYDWSVIQHASFQTLPKTAKRLNDLLIYPTSGTKNRSWNVFFRRFFQSNLGQRPVPERFFYFVLEYLEVLQYTVWFC